MNLENPAFIDPSIDSRAVTFENPTGARGAGGSAHGGRKGAPNMRVRAGESVVLADIDGPGTIRHVWMTIPPAPPEVMRSLFIEVFYDGMTEPSISVPFVDFFGLPHGRPVEYHSALHAVQEGRGFNSYVPMPFGEHVRIVATNGGERSIILYYQVDYTLGPLDEGAGYLHVGFRRQNPTTQTRDFVIVDGLEGPGRFLGCAIGIRVIDTGDWYGEGEVKVFRDGDDELPTICGTGLEDYVGSAWGMGAHAAPYGGAPLNIGPGGPDQPEFVSFYRWHVLDPIMFTSDLKVTIQQIGAKFFPLGDAPRRPVWKSLPSPAGHRMGRGIALVLGFGSLGEEGGPDLLDGHPHLVAEDDRVEHVPAVEAHELQRGQGGAGVGRVMGAEAPRRADVVLEPGAADRRPFAVPVAVNLHFPLAVPDAFVEHPHADRAAEEPARAAEPFGDHEVLLHDRRVLAAE